MKQSTSFAQVATNLLNVLQGYTKGIRFIAVLTMLLIVGIGQVWGAEGDIIKSFDCTVSSATTYARYTPSCDDIKWNISWGQTNYIGTNKSGNYANLKISNSTDLNAAKGVNSSINSNSQGYVTIIPQSAMSRVGKITISCTALSGSPKVYVVSSTSLSTSYSQIKLKTGNGLSAQGATMSTSGLTFEFDTQNQETYYAVVLYSTAWYRLTNTSIEFIEGASAPTCTPLEMSTVTATPGDSKITLTWSEVSNASSYTVECPGGTVGSVTGASTKTCTITGLTNGKSYNWSVMPVGNGTTYCEENTPTTGSTTPNATYSITYHDKDGAHSVDALGGSALLEVLPNNPTSCDIDIYPFFVGWSTTDIPSGGTTEQPTLVSAEIVNSTTASKTYYAVWSDVDPNAGGGSWEKATSISVGDKVVFVYEGKNRELTGIASNIGTATERTKGIPNGIEGTYVLTVEAGTANNSYSFKNGNIYLSWSSGNTLYTSNTKNNASSWTINTSTNGNFKFANVGTPSRILQFNSSDPRWACYTSSQSAFQIYKQSTAAGAATYITTCATTYNITANLSYVKPNGSNPTTVLETAEDLNLAYEPMNGWNLPATISVTMGGNPLILDDEYTWDKETGKVWIVPADGFTGDIVVTINGWQQLATPTNLSVTDITPTSATLSWDAVENASSYTVELLGENKDPIKTFSNLNATTITISDLESSTNYILGVVAVGDGSTYLDSEQTLSDVFTTASATCTVTYNANGGIGTPPSDETEYTNGATVTVLGNYGKLTKDGYAFTGWNTKADGSGDSYKHNDQFAITASTTLYAQWCEAYWKLVTNASELEDDTRIIIAAKEYDFALSTEQKTNNRGQAAITKKYNTVTFGTDVQTLTLVGLHDNMFALYTGSGYLYAAGSGSNNYLKTAVSDGNDDWRVSISQGVATILAQGTNTNNQLKYNAGSDLFSCYGKTNSQKDVVIYKEVCVHDQYNVTSNLTNATANTNPTTVDADATSLTLNYSANTGYLLPETITVKMGGVELASGTDYTWNRETGVLAITVTGFYGDIDVTIVAEEDPCYQFAMSEVTANFTTNSITLSWSEVNGATGYNVKIGTGEFTAANGLTHTFEGLSPKTKYTWEVQAVKEGEGFHCEASKTGFTTTQKETFTVSWIVNGNTESPYATESVMDGNKITTYPNDPSAPSGCNKKVFVGWTTPFPINTPTDEAPAILYKQKSDVPEITETTTLHAVWADEKTTEGEEVEVETIASVKISDYATANNWSNSTQYTTVNLDENITAIAGGGASTGKYYISGNTWRFYRSDNGKLTINAANGCTINTIKVTYTVDDSGVLTYNSSNKESGSEISINASSATFGVGNTNSAINGKVFITAISVTYTTKTKGPDVITYSAYTTLCDECTPSTLTLEADNTTADLDVNGKATITFSTTGGNGGEIVYAANPKTGVTWDNGTATFTKAGDYTITASQEKNGENCPTTSNTVNVTITAIPHLYFVTEPANPIVFDAVECGGNTALTNKKSVELQGYNLTSDVSVTVTGDYKIARTSSATLGEYSNSLTLDKNNIDGKINGNYDIVYILSCPPAGGTASTKGELTFTTEAGNTLIVNLYTPTVTCTPRTLTFNDRGNTTTQEYYAGAEVPQPEDPTGVCTDPIHYVFDGWAEATVAAGATTYTKVNFPYSMPAKNTTLYAVYRYTEENANSDKFMSVDKELGELVSGMDYVLTGYYGNNNDGQEYALSITAYESGKYKTKVVDVQESSLLYEEDIPYYEFTTTDNEIIWTIKGDDTNGYTFQNKTNNKFLAVEDEKLALSDNAAKFTIEHKTGVIDGEDVYYMSLLIQPVGSTKYLSSYYKNATAGVLFNLHTASTLSLYLYKRVASNLYTTSPACGPMLEITSGKDIYVTSGYGTGRNTVIAQQTVEYRATRLSTNNAGIEPDVKVAANGVTMGGVVTNNVKVVELTQNKEQIGDKYTITGTVTVQYTPTANNLQEDIQVQLAVDYNTDAKDNFTVHARSLPSEFVIAAKQGDKWYALNADMSGSDAEKANGYLQVDDIEDPTKATFAPCNTIYTFDGMVDGGNKEYMRFQGIDGKYLWAASAGNTGIQNYAKNTPTAGTIAYNWQLYTNDNETYQLQNEGNKRTLGLSKDLNFGMYSYVSTLQQDIRILPYEAKCLYNYAPSNLKVSVLKSTYVTLTWDAVAGATKYQYSTNGTTWTDAGTDPTVTINGLEPTMMYTIYIRAYHEDAGVSQECIDYAEITFTTADCDDVPTNITYSADLNSITVSWTAAAPTATITYNTKEDGTGGGGTIDNATSPYKISGGLNKNTTYYIQILAGGSCASPIIPVKTEDVEVDIVEWKPDGIIVDINTNEKIGVTLENEVSYGSGSGSLAEDLFFSKYFEGSGSLKMIAIYNGTGKDVDLTDYFIYKGHDGSANFDEDDQDKISYPLSELGVIKQGQEIVLYSWPLNTNEEASVYSCSQTFLHSIANESGQDANPRWILCGKDPTNSITPIYSDAMNFNGDDPLLLYKDGEIIDVFGATDGESPENNVICDGYNENGTYKTRSDESWVANDVSNMDYGKTAEDFPNGEIPDDVNVDDPTITAYTARVIMFRKNSVTSGANAVTKNTDDFHTFAEEWEVRQVCRISGDGDLTCAAYQELGTFDYSNYYTKYETMGDKQVFDEGQRNDDGTVNVEIPNLAKQSCRNIRVKLTNEDGEVLSDREYKVPIMITTTQGTDGQAFLALQENLATVEIDGNGNPTGNKTNLTLEQVREICKTCDVVVRDNATLTKIDDNAANDHPEVHDIYVYENSSLIVPNGTNYTINNLSLRRKEDAVASVSAYPAALKLPESAAAPISLDFRLSAENWHWFTLPYDCNISEVTWVDGSPAQYNVDWFLMTYDGETRAATQAGGCWKAYTGTTIKAGEGFILAINGNINNPLHTYELRFPMSKEVLVNEGTDKTVDVRAWGVETNIRPNHKGWNLVGNPYLAYYQRNNITNFEGLRLGQLTGPDPQTGYWEQTGDVPYVVVPVGAGWIAYEQVLASETDLLPFTAYFVQVGNDGKHKSDDELSIEFDHTKLQLSATPMPASIIQRSASVGEEPVIVGVSLTNSKDESDKTSLVIDNQFTDEYEMNADFFKWFGDYYKYYTKPVLYTIGADQGKRAFNAISEDLASQPISLGMFAAQTGNYTFSLDLRSDLSKVQEVWLYDATQDQYTNLMQDSYTFNTAKTESAGRFFLSVKMAPKVSTDINNVTDGTIWATTQDHTIFVNGLLSNAQLWIYDATGKLLHTDQTQYYQHTYQVPVSGTYFVRVQNTMQTQTIKVVVE